MFVKIGIDDFVT